MNFRYLLILFSVLGISSTFMPWLHYPKSGTVFYGYMADGILTGIFFTICLFYYLSTWKKIKVNKFITSVLGLGGMLLAFGSYAKIEKINFEKLTFTSNDPLIISMSAGFHEGIGIYIFGLAGLGIGITSSVLILQSKFSVDKGVENLVENSKLKQIIIGLIIVLLASFSSWYLIDNFNSSTPKTDELKLSISRSIDTMASTFINNNYAQFISYTHPSMLQSIGGAEKTIELLRSTNETLKDQQTKVSKIVFSDMYDIENDGKTIQALVAQKVTFENNEGSKDEIQKMIAISEDSGKSWKYINIGKNTKAEMTKLFPVINPNLEF